MQLNPTFLKLYKLPLLLALSSGVLYWAFAYNLVRTDYVKLLTLYAALFILFYKIVAIFKNHITFLSYLAFGLRAIFILAIPNLSQDFYRFIWDGRMVLEGINPYLFTPESFISTGQFPIAQAEELYNGMGTLNASHFSNYPPINQLCFVVAALFSAKNILGSVVVMRLIIIAADFGVLYFGKKLLKRLNMPVHHIFWYILNPFIIIELTGNLHFEGVMIFFMIWSFFLLHTGKWRWAAVTMALSISVKLVPLLFLPLFFQWFVRRNVIASGTKQSFKNHGMLKQVHDSTQKTTTNEKVARSLPPRNDIIKGMAKLITFYAIIFTVTLLLFAPFSSSEFISNYAQTVALWFQNFEFNASLYYIAREIGYTFRGYNEIAIIGKFTALIVFVFVVALSILKKNETTTKLITAMLFALSFYYFTATTVHPWYLAMLLVLSVFTNYKFPLVWSFMIVLSYLAYLNVNSADKSENLWFITLEYVVVYAVFIWEVLIKKAPKTEA